LIFFTVRLDHSKPSFYCFAVSHDSRLKFWFCEPHGLIYNKNKPRFTAKVHTDDKKGNRPRLGFGIKQLS
jgi:hypothetical protein